VKQYLPLVSWKSFDVSTAAEAGADGADEEGRQLEDLWSGMPMTTM
jgi:hypothetical protein